MKPDFKYTDERGTLTQLVRRGFSQINVITSEGGTCRGGHFHKLNTEAYYIVKGMCKVTAYTEKKKQSEIFSEGDFFFIGPYITHDFEYIENSILVTMYSLGIESDNGDMDSYEG